MELDNSTDNPLLRGEAYPIYCATCNKILPSTTTDIRKTPCAECGNELKLLSDRLRFFPEIQTTLNETRAQRPLADIKWNYFDEDGRFIPPRIAKGFLE